MIAVWVCALMGAVWTVAAFTADGPLDQWAAIAIASAWQIAANVILALVVNRRAA